MEENYVEEVKFVGNKVCILVDAPKGSRAHVAYVYVFQEFCGSN